LLVAHYLLGFICFANARLKVTKLPKQKTANFKPTVT
jgi:hypothetical protein